MMIQFVADIRERRSLLRLLRRALRPQGKRYFTLFDRHLALCVEGLQALVALLSNVKDPDGRVREIEAIEKRADSVVDEMRVALAQVWLPPLPRVAMIELINRLDDILDLSEDAAQSLLLYHVTRLPPEAVKLADLALEATRKLQSAVAQLARLSRPGAILALCAEVDALEAQADHVMRSAMSRLFREESDARQLVKLKAIYEVLESLTDKCKEVGNDLEAIVLRHG